MTIWNALWDIYGLANVYQVGTAAQRDEFEEMAPEKRASYGAIGGHGFLPVFQRIVGDLDQYYCFVTFRDPLERLWSLYNFIRRQPHHHEHQIVLGETFEQFVRRDLPNSQTLFLCGKADAEIALQTLSEFFDDWCFMEDIDALVRRLYLHLGLEPKAALHANRAPSEEKRSDIPEAAIAAFRQLNAADIRLYEELLKQRNASLALGGTKSAINE